MSGRQRRARNYRISRTSYWDADHFCTMIPAIGHSGCSREQPRYISTERALATSWFRLSQAARFAFNRRRAVDMKRLDRLQSPRLALLALLFGPYDRLPVRRQDEPRAGIGDFDPVAAGLVDIKKKRLLDGMLVRAGLDIDAVLEKNVGGAQDVLAAVERIGDVVETARCIGGIV